MGIGELPQFLFAQAAGGLGDERPARESCFFNRRPRALVAPRAFDFQPADFSREPLALRLQMLDRSTPALCRRAERGQ
jgi:hypothetical protein